MDPFTLFLMSSILAGLVATSLGGLPILFLGKGEHTRAFDLGNGLAAGLMLAASIFSLLLPGLEMAEEVGGNIGGVFTVSIGFLIGMFFILSIKDRVHVFYFKMTDDQPSPGVAKAIVIFIALTLHNMPEGMAVGVAFGSGDITLGLQVALAIGIQNIPEGFAVAAPLIATGNFSRRKSFLFSMFSGLVEPLNAVFAYILVTVFHQILPYMFGFCAGAMLFVVINEMIPETQHGEYFDKSTIAILFGFLIMFILDVALG